MEPTAAELKRAKDARVKCINDAFERMEEEIKAYLNVCGANHAPVKSIVVHGLRSGRDLHYRTTVKFHTVK